MSELIYRQRRVTARGWAVPVVLWLAATVFLLVQAPGGPSGFDVGFAVLAPGLVFGIWLLTLWSLDRYGTVTVTRDLLRVGRDSVEVARLDPVSVQAAAAEADPGLRERVLRSAGTLQLPGGAGTTGGRLLGGSYGTPLGSDQLTLRLRHGEHVIVPTTDRPGLLAALLTALSD